MKAMWANVKIHMGSRVPQIAILRPFFKRYMKTFFWNFVLNTSARYHFWTPQVYTDPSANWEPHSHISEVIFKGHGKTQLWGKFGVQFISRQAPPFNWTSRSCNFTHVYRNKVAMVDGLEVYTEEFICEISADKKSGTPLSFLESHCKARPMFRVQCGVVVMPKCG